MDPKQRDALTVVPETMAAVYRIFPLRYEAGVLTVALEAGDEAAMDDLKHLLGLQRVDHVIWPREKIEQRIAACYAGREDDSSEWLRRLQ